MAGRTWDSTSESLSRRTIAQIATAASCATSRLSASCNRGGEGQMASCWFGRGER